MTILNRVSRGLVPESGMLGTIFLFMFLWNYCVTGTTSIRVIAALSLLTCLIYVYGRICARLLSPLELAHEISFPLQFLLGFFAFNTLLFFLSIFSPLSLNGNVILLCLVGAIILIAVSIKPTVASTASTVAIPDFAVILISAIGATEWSIDPLGLANIEGTNTIFHMWPDCFFHARQISVFAQGHGFGTLSDLQMSGAPPHIYHYAMYITPAVVMSLTNTGALEAFAGFALPFGIMLTGFGAYSLIKSLWGAWPGVAAACAVILMPDAYQQGFSNKLLSVNFIQQVSVGTLYGVALAALAWQFLLDGCQRGKYGAIIIAYALTFLCIFYKAHIFVANALLVLLYPTLFFSNLKPRWRVLIAIVFLAVFVSVVRFSQTFEGVPTLRFDGSGALKYSVLLGDNYEPGLWKTLYQWGLQSLKSKPILFQLFVGGMILVSTLGLWLIACFAGIFMLRSNSQTAVRWLPLFVMGNYVAMSLGLALEEKGVGMPEEFLHRPLVWVGFAVSAWSLGAVYYALFGDALPRGWRSRTIVGTLLLSSFVIPLVFARGLQTMSLWPGYRTYREYGTVPTCLVDAAHYIRDHGHETDLEQDLEGDTGLLLTSLSQRQAYAIFIPQIVGGDSTALRAPKEVNQRRNELMLVKGMNDSKEIIDFFSSRNITWLMLHPESQVSWPEELKEKSVFACGGYRLYNFSSSGLHSG